MEITTVEQLENFLVDGNIKKLWGFVLNNTERYEIEDFVKYCIKNSFDGKERITFIYFKGIVMYYYLEEPDYLLVEKITIKVCDFFEKIKEIKNSGFDDILENYKDWYKKNIGITPQVKDFFLYLVNSDNSVFNDENLKKYLAEHVFYEESKIIENYQQAKDKQKTLIDITPHQTLSIEPTTDNAEEGKR